MTSDAGRDLPEFTSIINEITALLADLCSAAARYKERGDDKRTFSVVMLIDSLDLARELMRDLQGVHGPELDSPHADSFSRN